MASASSASPPSSTTSRIVPASPDVAALYKYTEIPVNYYTGSVGIDLPLYTVKTRDLNVPISISYHSSGIKVEEEASSVGLGWTLNAGGAIQHIVRGMDDFEDFGGNQWRRLNSLLPNSSEICQYYANDNYAMFNAKLGQPLVSDIENMTIINGYKPYANYELDIFAFNFGGKSGKFLLVPLGNNGYDVRLLDQSDMRIRLVNDDVSGNSGFMITDSDGTKYYFQQREIQRARSTGMVGNGFRMENWKIKQKQLLHELG